MRATSLSEMTRQKVGSISDQLSTMLRETGDP
jgi:hypothetical protein